MEEILQMEFIEFIRNSIVVIIIVFVALIAGAVALLVMAAQQVRELDIPEDADFFETMQLIPITVPIALDMLDLALDFLSAPVAWILLDMLGLGALKMITIVESVIPGTQLIPTMTIAWVISRTFIKDRKSSFREQLREQQMQGRGMVPRLDRGRGGGSSRADRYRNLALPPGERAGRVGDDVLIDGRSVRSGRSNRSASRLGGLSPIDGDDLVEGEYYDDSARDDRNYRRSTRNRDDYGGSEDFDQEEY